MTFTKEQLENAYTLCGSMKKAAEALGLSKTQFRQHLFKARNICIHCMETLDKKGLICSKCLQKSRDKVKENLPKHKNCKQCSEIMHRKEEQGNISWATQRICDTCEKQNVSDWHKKDYEENKEKYLEKSRNRKEYYKVYRKTEKCKLILKISNSKRRAQKRNTQVEDLREYITYLFKHKNKCEYCNNTENLTIEHIIPLARNGTHTKENITLACATCNSRKGKKTKEEYFIFLERLQNKTITMESI